VAHKLRLAAAATAFLVATAALAAQPAAPRTHSYLRIDGVLGASDDPSHLGWFDVTSWSPTASTPDGRATARLRLVGVPPADLAAAIATHKKLHEALLQDVRVGDGAPVRNVSFWQFEITGLAPAKAPARSYAVTLQATHVVCDDYGPAPADGGPCAALKSAQQP
jgi:hypothetical protein